MTVVDVTPCELRALPDGGVIYVKRDDLYVAPGGAPGGKARTCYAIAQRATRGLVTSGSRSSPQVNIVAQIGAALGLPVRIHTPQGEPGLEVAAAIAAGATRIEHFPGYNDVLSARARADTARLGDGWVEIPFGMECADAITQTAGQVHAIPWQARRIVVAVGSGMTLAGILHGLDRMKSWPPRVAGIVVGSDPAKRLDRWAPPDWRFRVDLIVQGDRHAYHRAARGVTVAGLPLDPFYEAKCLPYLRDGDLFWVVGIRQTELPAVLADDRTTREDPR
jgi:1-aminocyclopropane-1-carboxylate deaminase/D-cysteine desulfhydrase-like pyridoxal-dependent ACC family enzyme